MAQHYTVRFSETVHYATTVTADSPQEACAQVREQFEQGGYVHEETTSVSDYVAEEAPATATPLDILRQAQEHINTAAEFIRSDQQQGALGALIFATASLQRLGRNLRTQP